MVSKKEVGIDPRDIFSETGTPVRQSSLVPVTQAPRQPTVLDRDFEQFTLWRVSLGRNGAAPQNGSEGDLWYLSRFTATGDAIWLKIATGSVPGGTVISLTGDDLLTVFADGAGDIDVRGLTVANATHAKAVFTKRPSANQLDIDVQVSAAIAATDITRVGMSAFDNTQFAVDVNGFVSLIGGGAAIDTLTVDTFTAPATTAVVVPNAGDIRIRGATVASGTNPIRTNSNAASEYTIEAQLSAAVAASDATKNGLAHFDSAYFTVNANGFVQGKFGFQPGVSNLGITYAAGTFTVTSASGVALDVANPAYVTLPGKTAGEVITVAVTADQSFTDGAAGSIDNMRWDVTTGVDWASDCPFYLYAVVNDAETEIAFMITRVPHRTTSPAAAAIGESGAIVNTGQGDFYSLRDITIADYEQNPALLIGAFRMQFAGATDSWTVQALTNKDGIGNYHEDTTFTYPVNQNGATAVTNATTHFIETAGFPAWTNRNASYNLKRNGSCQYQLLYSVHTAAGVNANQIHVTTPLRTLPSMNIPIGGYLPGSLGGSQFQLLQINTTSKTGALYAHGVAGIILNTDIATVGAAVTWSFCFTYTILP